MDVYEKLFTQLIIPEYGSQFLLQVMLVGHKIVFINPPTYQFLRYPHLCQASSSMVLTYFKLWKNKKRNPRVMQIAKNALAIELRLKGCAEGECPPFWAAQACSRSSVKQCWVSPKEHHHAKHLAPAGLPFVPQNFKIFPLPAVYILQYLFPTEQSLEFLTLNFCEVHLSGSLYVESSNAEGGPEHTHTMN